ncbi:hypothetical protein ZIOFF_034675 [Zingiber officinale]|uniref:FLZ-type domain-containing protein n=1 Tax=Zingiber officinale TaxID=94328 RepID=A0A8J5GQ29_ZINOF|nr:hypothetical protein ZIOFF_034675 [Zingiber officinale]
MSDPHSSNSSCCNKSRAFSIFSSPRLFVGVSSSSSSDSEAAMSPTSILETKSLSSIGRQLLSDATKSSGTESKLHARSFGNTDAVGLSIIDALNEEKSTKAFPNSESRRVVFGSLLKVQIPSLCAGPMSPVRSPIEFGVKNKESQLALLSPAQSSLGLEMTTSSSCRVFARSISMSEMELSEDYTCVISHGPNPRTTHIFDNCIVESCGDGFTASIETNSSTPTDRRGHLSNDFLSFCYACRKDLGQGNDTFICSDSCFTGCVCSLTRGPTLTAALNHRAFVLIHHRQVQIALLFLAALGIHGGDSTDCPIDEEPKKPVTNPALVLNQSP